MFGKEGVSAADNRVVFDYRMKKAEYMWRKTTSDPTHLKYFTDRMVKMLTTNFETKTELKWVADLGDWTNNNCESMNHILKNSTNWKTQPITTLVKSLKKVVKTQYDDVKAALAGQGDFKLSPPFKQFEVPIDVWNAMTPERRTKHFNRFMCNKWLVDPKLVVSTNGNSVFQGPGKMGGKKPHQKKGRRKDRTTTFRKKNKLK